MFGEKDFETAYQHLQKRHYSKALPYLYEAAQQGHPLAYVWIENIYTNGLDTRGIHSINL